MDWMVGAVLVSWCAVCVCNLGVCIWGRIINRWWLHTSAREDGEKGASDTKLDGGNEQHIVRESGV